MSHRETSIENFGLFIAYLLPGFTVLWGTSYFSEPLRNWLGAQSPDGPTLGGFLYVTVGSIAAGLTASTVRWLLIDTLHHWTGIPQPRWDFSRLQENVAAFDALVHIHYRYYQFYANSLVAMTFVYLARRLSLGFFSLPVGWPEAGFFGIAIVFLLGSRDTMRKYYARVALLLGELPPPTPPPPLATLPAAPIEQE